MNVRQRVDIKNLGAQCEANYWRLQAIARTLFTDGKVAQGDSATLSLPRLNVALSLLVCDVARYTDTINLIFQAVSSTKAVRTLEFSEGMVSNLVPSPMVVRVYHDLQVAEVFDFDGLGAGKGRYDYPNERMMQPDEKLQQNIMLGQWLAYALTDGLVATPLLDDFGIAEDAKTIPATPGMVEGL